MTITLPPDLEKRLQAEVQAGFAPSLDVLVERGLRAHLDQLQAFRRSLDEAEADYRKNGGASLEEVRGAFEARRKGLDAAE